MSLCSAMIACEEIIYGRGAKQENALPQPSHADHRACLGVTRAQANQAGPDKSPSHYPTVAPTSCMAARVDSTDKTVAWFALDSSWASLPTLSTWAMAFSSA